MGKMKATLSNRWRALSRAAAVLLIFLAPATRGILGNLFQSSSASATNNQPRHQPHHQSDSRSVPSVSMPSSRDTVSPMKPHQSGQPDQAHHGRKPKHK